MNVQILHLPEGAPMPLKDEIEHLKVTSGAKFFDPENPIFPEAEFHLCTKADIFPFALRPVADENGLRYMKKENVL